MQPDVDYDAFTTEQVKSQLGARGVSTKGNRNTLIKRLKAEVTKAWKQFNAAQGAVQPLFPDLKTKKPKKPAKTPEEIEAEQKALAVKRQEKLKRKAEHEKRVEEARQRKKQKREEKAKKVAELQTQQKAEKERRQKCEMFLGFDMRSFEQQVRKKLDPSGKKIANCSYDTVHKRFKVKFISETEANKFTKGISMKKPKKLKFDSSVSILPSPVESRCVMFLYPMAPNHPSYEVAKTWSNKKGLSDSRDSNILEIWKQDALKQFSKYGPIINIFRERGFLVVQFTTDAQASKMLATSKGKTFNGATFTYLKSGTPTKLDKKTVDQQFPKPVVKKEE